MNFVLVNHRTLRRPSRCVACYRPLQRSYLHDLSTHSRYCSVKCYPGPAAGSMVRSLAEPDAYDLVIPGRAPSSALNLVPKNDKDVLRIATQFKK